MSKVFSIVNIKVILFVILAVFLSFTISSCSISKDKENLLDINIVNYEDYLDISVIPRKSGRNIISNISVSGASSNYEFIDVRISITVFVSYKVEDDFISRNAVHDHSLKLNIGGNASSRKESSASRTVQEVLSSRSHYMVSSVTGKMRKLR